MENDTICDLQLKVLEKIKFFETERFPHIIGSTMIISIMFGTFVIVLYLLSKTLRTSFFGKCVLCHMFNYIIYQVIYLYSIFYFKYSSFTFNESNLFVWQLSFQLMSQFWMNLLSYHTYAKLKKWVKLFFKHFSNFYSYYSPTTPVTAELKKIIILNLASFGVCSIYFGFIYTYFAWQYLFFEILELKKKTMWKKKILYAPSILVEFSSICFDAGILYCIWKSNKNFSHKSDSRRHAISMNRNKRW